jgi:hypothetical protein
MARTLREPGAEGGQLIRTYYSAWEQKQWSMADGVLAEEFTFSSPHGDDHIDKSAFKAKCWNGQLQYIARFELEVLLETADEAFVKYRCRTTNGASFANVEYFRFSNGKIRAIECYFGGLWGYPSAAAQGRP